MNTFKTKMLFLILGILVITTVIFLVLTQNEVEKAMLNSSHKTARDILHLVKLNVESEYKSLLFHKEYALGRYKEQLQNVVGIVVSHIDSYYEMFEKGILSEEDAKRFALKSVEQFRFGNNDYFYIYDLTLYAISHPDPNVLGTDMTNFTDIKGKYVLQVIKEMILEDGETYNSFWYIRLGEDAPAEKLTYSFLYKKWNWIIGTGLYIDDIESDAKEKLNEIVEELKDTFSKITVGETGYFFMFNGDKYMIIHPFLGGSDLSNMKNPVTGNYHIDDLIIASNNPEIPLSYVWNKPPEYENEYKFWKEAYIDYFPPLDWYIATSVYRDEMRLPAKIIIRRQIIIAGLILLISIVIIFILVKRFTKPLGQLTEHARQLASTDFSPIATKSLERLSEKSKDEMGKLAKAFIYMENTLRVYIKNLKETTAANERINSELHIAHDIQMGMIPQSFPAFPDRNEIDIYASIEPAKEVGGDFYDYFFIDEYNLCFIIGDVSDKGVPASLFMARSKSLLQSTTSLMTKDHNKDLPVGEILFRVNEELYRDNDLCMFVTIFYGILNVKSGELRYSICGHNPPYLISDKGSISSLGKSDGPPLGIKRNIRYKSHTLKLKPEDCIFLYTDGVTEAMNSKGEEFTEERLIKYLDSLKGAFTEEIINGIMKNVNKFASGVQQSDDITVLAIRFYGKNRNVKVSDNGQTKVTLKNDLNELERLKNKFKEFTEYNIIDDNIVFDLTLVLEEIFINIISYAYEDKKEHQINISFFLENDSIIFEINDDGKPFDPTKYIETVLDKESEDKEIGGRGLKLVKSLIDSMKYYRKNNMNVLIIKKYPERKFNFFMEEEK